MEDLEALKSHLMRQIEAAADLAALEELRVAALGRKGRITELMKGLGGLDAGTRKEAGRDLNLVKDALTEAIEGRKAALADAELDAKLQSERIDVTIPPRPEAQGRIHPISQTIDELSAIFGEMGFAVAEGPDI